MIEKVGRDYIVIDIINSCEPAKDCYKYRKILDNMMIYQTPNKETVVSGT